MFVGQLQLPLIKTRRLFGEGFFTSSAVFPTPPKRTLKHKREKEKEISQSPQAPLPHSKKKEQTYKRIPWVPEVFSRVRRGASFRRPQADTCWCLLFKT